LNLLPADPLVLQLNPPPASLQAIGVDMGDVKNISVFDACAVVSILKNPDLVSDLRHCYSLTRGQLMHFRTNLPAIHTEMKQWPGQVTSHSRRARQAHLENCWGRCLCGVRGIGWSNCSS